ncbi:MAG: phosphatidylglycerophosphatase A [Phycisphaerae bacterium]|jgi:phosphatidylglycerophosphatase A|nr:phosphatidylglycerophosphatase A [Phycisphaerae bacterium]MCZ2398739.1 phosphatidylglycerophosphatase A [Phycisphaerae bacterium]NUQ48605.1 phosphatidylglycerophosphatase A [Phycisphaerae bacterium]
MGRRADRVRELAITVAYTGYAPVASGSFGSLAAVLVLAGLLVGIEWLPWPVVGREAVLGAGIALASWGSVRWGPWALARFASKDPKPFVLDEFAGQWVALLAMPLAGAGAPAWAIVLGGQFILFRIMDVIKPPPARQLERLPAGWGVLADDLMAGVYANLVGQVLWRLWSPTALAAALGG